MKIYLTGYASGLACGVSDYTMALAKSLRLNSSDVDVEVMDGLDFRNISSLLQAKNTILHIQYPAAVYRLSLTPQLLAWLYRHKTVITIHEYTQAHWSRKVAMTAFARAATLIFTSDFERNAYLAAFRRSSKTSVIPIGSNIPAGKVVNEVMTGCRKVLFFGLIRQNKGLEEFITLARLARGAGSGQKFIVVGCIPAGFEKFYQQMFELAASCGDSINWHLNLPDEQVAQLIAECSCAYLHYPDGATARRGSLMAALANGVPVITSRGAATPPDWADCVSFAGSPAEAMVCLDRLDNDPILRRKQISAGFKLMEKHSWDQIASEHIQLYRGIVAMKGGVK